MPSAGEYPVEIERERERRQHRVNATLIVQVETSNYSGHACVLGQCGLPGLAASVSSWLCFYLCVLVCVPSACVHLPEPGGHSLVPVLKISVPTQTRSCDKHLEYEGFVSLNCVWTRPMLHALCLCDQEGLPLRQSVQQMARGSRSPKRSHYWTPLLIENLTFWMNCCRVLIKFKWHEEQNSVDLKSSMGSEYFLNIWRSAYTSNVSCFYLFYFCSFCGLGDFDKSCILKPRSWKMSKQGLPTWTRRGQQNTRH